MSDNRRDGFVYNTLSKFQECDDHLLFDYEGFPVRTFKEAVETIIPLNPHFMDYVQIAMKKCYKESKLLDSDESAAIYLYTMPTAFFSILNDALRSKDRHAVEPWLAYLKLFITALKKLPPIKGTIWRAIPGDVHVKSRSHDTRILWPVTSCSMDFGFLKARLGEKGTLFAIDAIYGRDVSAFSALPVEKEVILMPGTHVRDKCLPLDTDCVVVAHLEEIDPEDEMPFELNKLLQKIKDKYQRNDCTRSGVNPSKAFPVAEIYIDLTVVEAREVHEKEKQLYNVQRTKIAFDIFEKIYDSKTATDIVGNIFDACKKPEKQVLILGRAGIGKSTFCRYIAYQWANGLLWPHYELLALIPLRRLTADRYPPLKPGQRYSLTDLIKQEIFQFELSDKDEMLLKKHFDVNKILWILDGYDEIVQNVPPHLKCLFEQLLQTPHHIITSRPYLVDLKHEAKMEITGFSNEKMKEYVKSFFEQIKHECDDVLDKSQILLKSLSANPRIWGAAHIPVNLELICSVWSNEDLSEIPKLTITSLYSKMVEWSCRRYLVAQHIPIQMRTSEVYQVCQKELAFLERVAIEAVKMNTAILPSSVLTKVLDELNISSEDYPQILNMGILKGLNKQRSDTQIESDKDYYFVHIILQEYFVARYLVNTLKEPSTETAPECIHKCDQRYSLTFIFLCGLLSENNAKIWLHIFWKEILGKPFDLFDIRHLALALFCIGRISDESILSRRTDFSHCIANCIRCSSSTGSKTIRQELLHSLRKVQSGICQQIIIDVLINLLQCNDRLVKAEALFLVSKLVILDPPKCLITLITTSLMDENKNVRLNACKALGKMREKVETNAAITKLVSALGDNSAFVQERACEVLGKLGQERATDLVISNLLEAMDQSDEYIRANTCEVLGNIGEKGAKEQVISKLVKAVGDQDDSVRANACKALGKMGKKLVTHYVISKLVNALGDCKKNVRANACETLGEIYEESVTNEVIIKLVSVLGDNDEDVRWAASKAFEKIRKKASMDRIIGPLLSALRDESEYVRKFFCDVLLSLGEESIAIEEISKLVSVLEEDDDECIRDATHETHRTISEIPETNIMIQKLLNALKDPNELVRRGACEAFGKMREKKQRQMT